MHLTARVVRIVRDILESTPGRCILMNPYDFRAANQTTRFPDGHA